MNLSYPKKIVNSFIENEYLTERPNFRYKKAIILLGANASGKTSLGRMLEYILNLIEWKDPSRLYDSVADMSRQAKFSVDFLIDEPVLYRVSGILRPISEGQRPELRIQVRSVKIRKSDSYETCRRLLEQQADHFTDDINKELEKVPDLGWAFRLSENISNADSYDFTSERSLRILETVLKVLDPSIQSVRPIDDVRNSFVIQLDQQQVIIQDGKAANVKLLSTGTYDGIAVAEILSRIIERKNGFYYCDEKFSCIQSDVEKAILSIMIDKLPDYEQLFFTTHNTDVLDMPYPKHTFLFLKKDVQRPEQPITVISADEYLKRNTDSLRSAVENDLFGVTPDVDALFKLEEC
ncbi:MAG: ATP-binding protein [Eubacterium sp.]|nr:ATP-binding protein [Eubacterium sp.]